MTSALNAVERAAYVALSAQPSIGAAVFQHVPEDTAPPVVIIGDLESAPIGTKGDPDRRVALTVLAVTEAEERRPVLALLQEIEGRLGDLRVTVDNWNLAFLFDGADAVLTPEGDGYVGSSRFTILAFRA